MDLYEEIQRLTNTLTQSIKLLRTNGVKLAEAERDYKVSLAKEALKMKTDGMAVTLINQVIYGTNEVAELRFKRDVEQATYDANIRDSTSIKAIIKSYEGNIKK